MNGIIEALGGAKHRIECAMSRRLTLGAAIGSPRSSGGPAEGGRETNVRLTTKTTIFPLIWLARERKLTSPAEFVMLIASILANYALLPRREGLCVLMMADD